MVKPFGCRWFAADCTNELNEHLVEAIGLSVDTNHIVGVVLIDNR